MTRTDADGAAGARRAAAMLGIAACAETTSTTLSEDAAKVDMKLSFRHVFQPGKLLTVHAQVKSGRSYQSTTSGSSDMSLRIDHETLNALSGPATQGLIVWVPPKPLDRLYWYSSDPRRPLKKPIKICRHQYVRPSIRFDLTRLCTYASWSRSFSQQTASRHDASEILQRAKLAYASLKKQPWQNPLVGNLAITRFAWRHVTRRSKSTQRRTLILKAAPYLKGFISQVPDRYVCDQGPISIHGRDTVDLRYLRFWYRGALSIDGDKFTLLLRIKEQITYPTCWQNHPLGVADVRQCATLTSWWCKKDK